MSDVDGQTLLRLERERLQGQIELDWHQQRASGGEYYLFPYDLVSRLLAIALPEVPHELHQFVDVVNDFLEAQPAGLVKDVLSEMMNLAASGDPQGVGVTYRLYWGARWQAHGAPAINVERRLAASLMLSETPSEFLTELKPPWPCFVVRLPQGLIEFGDIPYTHVVVHQFFRAPLDDVPTPEDLPPEVAELVRKAAEFSKADAGEKWGIYGMSHSRGQLQHEASLSVLLGRSEPRYLIEPQFDSDGPEQRIIELLARLVVGVCQMCSATSSLRRKSTKKQGAGNKWRLGGAPLTTEYVLAPAVSIGLDCTEAVRSYAGGERSNLPKIQWIVRGHWRNQRVGPGGEATKRIWIQPHWKGPQEAPRLFREYEFVADG